MYKNTEARLKLLKDAKKVLSQLQKMNLANAALRPVSGEECAYSADEVGHLIGVYKDFCSKAESLDPTLYPLPDPIIFSQTGFSLVGEYTAYLKAQIEAEEKRLEILVSSKDS